MTVTKMTIEELDVVAFCRQESKWPAGTEGTVLAGSSAAMLIEIANEHGEGLDFVWVPPEHLRLVWKCPRRAS